jgi:hypothetical protein
MRHQTAIPRHRGPEHGFQLRELIRTIRSWLHIALLVLGALAVLMYVLVYFVTGGRPFQPAP